MRLNHSSTKIHGLTQPEVAVIVFVLVLLGLTLFPALASAKRKAGKIHCTNNLMQIGMAFRIWEDDHYGNYPMRVPATNTWPTNWVPVASAVEAFQMTSNELTTPFILFCPSDRNCRPAVDFGKPLKSGNVSYFVNMTATESQPEGILAGDDNFEIGGAPIETGLWEISSNTPIAWSAERHRLCGNVTMADGSVQGFTNPRLREWLLSTNVTPMRLSIP